MSVQSLSFSEPSQSRPASPVMPLISLRLGAEDELLNPTDLNNVSKYLHLYEEICDPSVFCLQHADHAAMTRNDRNDAN